MRRLINKLFGRSNHSSARQVRPAVETLETRQLMSVGIDGNGGLVIQGGGQNDWAWISPVANNGKTYYRVYGNLAGVPTDKWFDPMQVRNVQFRGYAGNDDFANNTSVPCWMWGGDGNDKLDGGSGQDVIYGDAGDDYIADQTTRATANWDNWFFGGFGNDTIQGSAGNDQIHGDAGVDNLFGGNGIDYLWGDDGNDRIEGGWGNDALWGGNGDDLLAGQQGDDWLAGNAGRDTLYGASGRDRFDYDTLDFRDLNAAEGDTRWV